MVDREEIRLQKMGLTKQEACDTFLDHEDKWHEKKYLYDELVKSDLFENKPKGTYFEIAENPGDKLFIPCHLIIPVVVLEATVTSDLDLFDDDAVELEAENTWAMEEAADWNKEYMTFDEFKAKDQMVPFKHASDPETYPVSDYCEYIPVNVRNAENKYKRIFFNKHVRTHANLKMNMIDLSYRIFKCNTALTSIQKIEGTIKKFISFQRISLSEEKRNHRYQQ